MGKNFLRSLSIKAILAGSVAWFVAYNIFGAVLFIILLGNIGAYPTTEAEATEAFKKALLANMPFMVMLMLISTLCSVLSGYVAAKIAKCHPRRNGAFATSILCVYSVYDMVQGDHLLPVWLDAFSTALIPFFGMLGGALYAARKTANARFCD